MPRSGEVPGPTGKRIVAKTRIDTGGRTREIEVSTVDLSLGGMSFGRGFETMVFAPDFPDIDQDNCMWRHDSRMEAVAGHDEMVQRVLAYLDKVS